MTQEGSCQVYNVGLVLSQRYTDGVAVDSGGGAAQKLLWSYGCDNCDSHSRYWEAGFSITCRESSLDLPSSAEVIVSKI